MLYSVRGKLIAIESNAAVVECGGVGYMCQTTMNTLKAVKLNTEVTLYTVSYTHLTLPTKLEV